MTVALRPVMAAGTPSEVLRALKNPNKVPDHEDLVLLLKNVLELLDELDDRLYEVEKKFKNPDKKSG